LILLGVFLFFAFWKRLKEFSENAIWVFFQISLEINDSLDSFQDALDWVMENRTTRVSKMQAVKSKRVGDMSLRYQPGIGSLFFIYEGHIFRLRRQMVTDLWGRRIGEITIHSLGWSPKRAIDRWLLQIENLAHEVRRESTAIRSPNPVREYQWTHCSTRASRRIQTVILPHTRRDDIIQDLGTFLESSDWYENRGFPYRRGYLFYGPPGTGKSSLAFALAGHFNLDVYLLPLVGTTELKFGHLLSTLPPRCLVLLEDVDAAGVPTAVRSDEDASNSGAISLSGLLNGVDGVTGSNGRVLVMTTNHRDRLDPAFIRPGRVDFEFEFTLATNQQIHDCFMLMFSNELGERAVKHASEFAAIVPENLFTVAQICQFLLPRRSTKLVFGDVSQWLKENLPAQEEKVKEENTDD
jgi:chaperone BCS1